MNPAAPPRRGVLRHSRWDALPLALALLHGAALVAAPSLPLIALGLWWNSNTIAHLHIHNPFFRSRALNALFALYESVLLGVPQTVWRGRHLAHHAGTAWRPRLTAQLVVETAAVLALWGALAALAPRFLLTVYAPGYALGLVLCHLQGHFEHHRGTVSHHGALYNLLFLNDGYHVEHHDRPGLHWTELPSRARGDCPRSRWPAVLRWLDWLSLEGLERAVLRSPRLQRFVLAAHERALRALLPAFAAPPRVVVVGGGLFPRTLLALRRVLPGATFVVLDRSPDNLREARARADGPDVTFVHGAYEGGALEGFDLAVFPLAFAGDRGAVYARPPAPVVAVHDWVWRRRGAGAVVSWLLLKRLNLVRS